MFLSFEGDTKFGFYFTIKREIFIREEECEEEVIVPCPCCEGCGRIYDNMTDIDFICPNCDGEGEFSTYVYYTIPERWEEVESEEYMEITTYEEGLGGYDGTDYFSESDIKELEERFLND